MTIPKTSLSQIKAVVKLNRIISPATTLDYIVRNKLKDYTRHSEYIINLGVDDYIEVFKKKEFNKSNIEKICFRNGERVIKKILL